MSNAWERVRRWGWRGVKIAAVLAILAGAAYGLWWAPVAVTPHRVEQGVLVAEVMGTGTLEAPVKTTISSKISGRIAEVKVDQGDRVKAGALLVRLDDEELQQQVAIAEANREATEAAIERLKTDKDRATVVFERAERSHARLQTLSAERAVSREDLDRAAEAMAVAQAELSRAEAAIAEGQKEVVAAEKTLEYHSTASRGEPRGGVQRNCWTTLGWPSEGRACHRCSPAANSNGSPSRGLWPITPA